MVITVKNIAGRNLYKILKSDNNHRLFMTTNSLTRFIFSTILVCVVALTISCGANTPPSTSPSDVALSKTQATYAQTQLTLMERTQKILSYQWLEPCYQLLKDKILEVASILDDRTNEISEFTKHSQVSDRYERLPFGPIYLRKEKVRRSFPTGWQEQRINWYQVYEEFQQIKKQPMSSNWVFLNREFRYILLNEEERILGGLPYTIDRNSELWLRKALEQVKNCQNDSQCTDPIFSNDIKHILDHNSLFSNNLSAIQNSDSLEKKRTEIKQLIKNFETALTHYELDLNPNVIRTNEHELVLSLNPGSFIEVEEPLADSIEKKWYSNELHLKIKWEESNSNIFKFIALNDPGERGGVDPGNKSINIESDIPIEVFAHEIGHVLGFSDLYFDVWRSEECGYILQINNDDLMSNSNTGHVTSEEWDILNKNYPPKMN